MKAGVLAATLAFSAAMALAAEPDALNGCWASRTTAGERMVWGGGDDPSSWRGQVVQGDQVVRTYQLDPTGGEHEQFGWALYPIAANGVTSEGIATYFGSRRPRGLTEWYELRVTRARLRLLHRIDGRIETLFDGNRATCAAGEQ